MRDEASDRGSSAARGVRHLKGVQDIHSGVSKGIHSVPPRNDRYYLDLYLLQMESERLSQEATSIQKRNTRIERRLAEISREMAMKEQKASENLTGQSIPAQHQGSETAHQRQGRPEQTWKRMPLRY
ncbi:MAG: hypothetical protein HYY03_00060 [Chloroflexi bacterium]|nr:hypothetical protein [Chloroflexota bacterium]